jgi:formamidopyrimidine-DNA glycosylase
MPELPEVEAARLSFAQQITGAQIRSVELGKPLRWPLADDVGVCLQGLRGARVGQVTRRGKYILLHLSDGVLLLHLGMSGSLRWHGSALIGPRGPHDHMDLTTDRGVLRLNDPRRFGAVVWVPSLEDAQATKLLAHLGVEPLSADFLSEPFAQKVRQSTSTIKAVLLAGQVVVGVGNIYASEALFRAGIRPTSLAHRIGKKRLHRLHAAIVSVLQEALDSGGSTLRNYSNALGERGSFQNKTFVYDRADEPCHVCQTKVRMIRQGQRSSFYCPSCQKA